MEKDLKYVLLVREIKTAIIPKLPTKRKPIVFYEYP
jgi:hypothetical protein